MEYNCKNADNAKTLNLIDYLHAKTEDLVPNVHTEDE
jgi:hypothetical protein